VAKGGNFYPSGEYWTYCYDPLTDNWTELSPLPYHHPIQSFAELGGKLYGIGGQDPSEAPPAETNRVDIYDPSTDSWELDAIPRMLYRRGDLEPVTPVICGKIYVMGGWNGYRALSEVEVYDPSTNAWTELTPMPTPRWSLATAVVKGKIYAIGGNQYRYNLQLANEEFTPEIVRAWKDDTSVGLENDRLLLHGSAVAGNYLWFFDYLIFKETGTMWYQPWDELAIIVYPIGSLGPWVTDPNYEINAFTEADKAYLTYSITSGNLRQDVTYTVYRCKPYIYISSFLTNIGSTIESTSVGVQFTTWIAGDYANDYYYVPGYGERQFTGTTKNTYYPDATEMWVAEWDQSKGEGAGILSTQGFEPSDIMSIDWGGATGEGFRFTSDRFDLAPSHTSQTYDCYLYFFTGTGWQKIKDFYDSIYQPPILHATVDINPNTLNLRSKGKWITVYIELPEGRDVNDIDVSTILLNDTIPAEMHPTGIGDYDDDGIPDLMVKFYRAEVISYILASVDMTALFEERLMTVALTVTGHLNDDTPFQGSDTIKILYTPRGVGKGRHIYAI